MTFMKKEITYETESKIQSVILRYLTTRRILHWRQNLGGVAHSVSGKMVFKKNPMKGFPDIVCLHKGQLICFEVKSAKGKASPEQVRWHQDLTVNGGYAYVVKSLDDVIELLDHHASFGDT
jgi:hypothetical protein